MVAHRTQASAEYQALWSAWKRAGGDPAQLGGRLPELRAALRKGRTAGQAVREHLGRAREDGSPGDGLPRCRGCLILAGERFETKGLDAAGYCASCRYFIARYGSAGAKLGADPEDAVPDWGPTPRPRAG